MYLYEEEDMSEYLSEEFVEDGVDSDAISPREAAFIAGWRSAEGRP